MSFETGLEPVFADLPRLTFCALSLTLDGYGAILTCVTPNLHSWLTQAPIYPCRLASVSPLKLEALKLQRAQSMSLSLVPSPSTPSPPLQEYYSDIEMNGKSGNILPNAFTHFWQCEKSGHCREGARHSVTSCRCRASICAERTRMYYHQLVGHADSKLCLGNSSLTASGCFLNHVHDRRRVTTRINKIPFGAISNSMQVDSGQDSTLKCAVPYFFS